MIFLFICLKHNLSFFFFSLSPLYTHSIVVVVVVVLVVVKRYLFVFFLFFVIFSFVKKIL